MKKIEIKIDCRSKDFTLKQNLRKEVIAGVSASSFV